MNNIIMFGMKLLLDCDAWTLLAVASEKVQCSHKGI